MTTRTRPFLLALAIATTLLVGALFVGALVDGAHAGDHPHRPRGTTPGSIVLEEPEQSFDPLEHDSEAPERDETEAHLIDVSPAAVAVTVQPHYTG